MRLASFFTPLLAGAIAACGSAFTSAGPNDASPPGDAAIHDAGPAPDGSGPDAAIPSDAGSADARSADASPPHDATPLPDALPLPDAAGTCMLACPTGFDCVAGACVDAVATHFSPSANPGGNWSYGSNAADGQPFLPFTTASTQYTTLETWSIASSSIAPGVFFNNSPHSAVYQGSFTMDPMSVGFYPGPTGGQTIVRFTAPQLRSYTVNAIFTGLSGANSAPLSTVAVTVVINNSIMFSQTINTNSGGNSVTFSQPHNALILGQTIDFTVDYGTNINNQNDATGLHAVITAE